jgi:agmatine/peptidylarginine deiminase
MNNTSSTTGTTSYTMTPFKTLFLSLCLLTAGASTSYATTGGHVMTPAEQSAMPDYIRSVSSYVSAGFTNPPSSTVRASAEWEQIDALVVVWTTYTNIVRQIINYAQSETKVIVICSDSNAVITNLVANTVPITNVDFIQTGFNSIWCRDYGQWNVYTDDVDSLLLVDWIYNRPRAKDDTVPRGIASFTGLPLYETTTAPYDLIHTGGNFMCDGLGTGFSSRLVLDENPTKTEPQVDSVMLQFMGIDRYIKMSTLPYDQIHHIDMHMKLLDEETILVGEYPPGTADGPRIDSNIAYIRNNFLSPFGTPYKFVRIPMPPDANGLYPDSGGDYRTYTNAVFVNKTIIVPTYAAQYDSTALRIWRETMPGYRVVGINCNQIITSLGAIHCITKEVSAKDQLWIVHQPLRDQASTVVPYTVNAEIRHKSGIASAMLYWRTDTLLPYSGVAMSSTGNNNWTADIPAQANGTIVYYYIHAEAVSGKQQNRPITAPSGYWKFRIDMSLGTDESLSALSELNVFPNPSNGYANVEIVMNRAVNVDVRLNDITGRTLNNLYSGTLSGERKMFRFDTTGLPAGIYMIEVRTGSYSGFRKLIVQ